MKNLRYVLCSFIVMVACAPTGDATIIDQNSSLGVLSYSSESGQLPNSLVFTSPGGQAYRLSLLPEKDTAGRVVVLELVLQKRSSTDHEANLLDTTGRLHGYQPYFFAASDFAHGAYRSAYDDKRDMNIRSIGMDIQVKVISVAVEPVRENVTTSTQYRFTGLSLQVSADGAVADSSSAASQ